MSALLWTLKQGNGPILGTAIHSGHIVRPDIADILNVDDATRFREEDPYTDELTAIVDSRLIVHRSRFEMDLNRNRNCAIYTKPEDAWGIEVWKHPLEQRMIQITLQQYDAFYRMLDDALATMLQRHAKIVVLDFHSYNHQRQGPNAMPSPPAENPEIEIGTDTMDRRYWTFIVDPFIAALRDLPFRERRLDVR
ncbi:MAG: N-formylglutamate amidohydrolase, partial [Deltaproteobacteria bacterium]|nr:N-formylglutamate amidohydrolase [Deltaproteobacteria bacterium]